MDRQRSDRVASASRRKLLGSASILVLSATAGCLGGDGGQSTPTTPAGTGTATTGTGEPTTGTGGPTTETRTDQPTATTDRTQTTEQGSQTTGEPAVLPQTVELGADTRAWMGMSPDSIESVENPTLRLRAGTTYEITIENVDGAPHELKILDAEGEDVVSGEEVEDVGERATVRFTARSSFREYICDYHPTSMRGTVTVVE